MMKSNALSIRKSTIAKLNSKSTNQQGRTTSWNTQFGRTTSWNTQMGRTTSWNTQF